MDIEYDTHDHVNNKRIEVKSAKYCLYTKKGADKTRTMFLRIKNARGDSWNEKTKQQQIEDIFLTETQKFDKMAQQMDHIRQHLENIQRVICGSEQTLIRGDSKIFEK